MINFYLRDPYDAYPHVLYLASNVLGFLKVGGGDTTFYMLFYVLLKLCELVGL